MAQTSKSDLQNALDARYRDAPQVPEHDGFASQLTQMALRGSCRAFQDKPVALEVLQTLCAVALASPTKSDLQQRDIILVTSQGPRDTLAEMVSGQAWVAGAPVIAVFCGNGRRQRQLHDWNEVPFANDHLDSLFNATADAAIALGAFVTAAEAAGLGCCPISAVRNEPQAVSDLLHLPDHVFPFAGLAIGYPAGKAPISKRLPLRVTVHHDRYTEGDVKSAVEAYDADRAATQPYDKQRFVETFGEDPNYGWSTDKVRQYSQSERSSFGAFIRAKGFRLD